MFVPLDLAPFFQEDGALLTRDMIKRVLPRACRKAGLDRTIQWHVLRHTFASHNRPRAESHRLEVPLRRDDLPRV